MRNALPIFLVAFAAAAAGTGFLAAGNPSSGERFPHEIHEGLFTSCQACHAGAYGPGAIFSVTGDECAACHDGTVRPRVEWSPPLPPSGHLVFDHRLHVEDLDLECSTCHAPSEVKGRMSVRRAEAGMCFDCHESEGHLAQGTRCEMCHPSLAETPLLTAAQLAGFPKPQDHEASDFPFTHGGRAEADPARCGTCHGRETCEACHLNSEAVAAVQNLASSALASEQAARVTASWPRPESHRDPFWTTTHGAAAIRMDQCAHCHVQESCTGCHAEIPPPNLDVLPVPRPGGPSGIGLAGARPPNHDPGFYRDHRAAAATRAETCQTCHASSTCARCHGTGLGSGFHDENYIFRHASDVYARDLDCAGCHSTEVFCRDCHAGVGLAPAGSRSASYHDTDPLWLISHGRAARQSLDACASCHQQNDCLPCHSARSGWRINPHGTGFEPNRLGDRTLLMCSRCHLADPRP